MKKGEVDAAAKAFQEAIGAPLRSEQRTNQLLPRVLSRSDMLAIFFAVIFLIWDSSVQQIFAMAGPAIYLFWLLAITTFLVPGALVTMQLNRLMPANGSIYVWTHRALGSLWGFLAGFCAWFPGVLIVFETSNIALVMLQNTGIQVAGAKSDWLPASWQQGLFILIFILLTSALSCISLPILMKIIKGGALLCGLSLLLLGLAGLLWLLQGRTSQITLNTQSLTPLNSIGIYGVLILALLGVEVPFNMAAETRQPDAARFSARWGTLLVGTAYLVMTFGISTVVSLRAPQLTYTPLGAIQILFGTPITLLVSCISIVFLLCSAATFNISFARILLASALDSRLPSILAHVNRWKIPFFAIILQIAFAILLAVLAYFVVPWLQIYLGSHFTVKVNDMTAAVIAIIWLISMLFLFADLPILLIRYRKVFAHKPGELIAPPWVLYLCCGLGILASLIGIAITFSYPFDIYFEQEEWMVFLGRIVFLLLAFGLVSSAYPRLLSSLNMQTAIARENVHLYEELRVTHEKLRIAHERLSQLDRLKDAFLMTASHELRTPLTIVQGYLELLGEIPEEDMTVEMRRSFLDRARRACDELVLLQANIMDASNIQLDTAMLNSKALCLSELCQSIVELFEPLIEQQERHLELSIPGQIFVLADETRLKQVLRNLIANAMRYSPGGTPICISAFADEQNRIVSVSVSDRGSGVPHDKQEIIFERFVRLERDTHGVVRGSGLGLAICRELLEAMHGTISVESSGRAGEGSTFTFTLPEG